MERCTCTLRCTEAGQFKTGAASAGSGRPVRVQVVDHDVMGVVLAMLVEMWVVVLKPGVIMLQRFAALGRPDPGREHNC